MRKLIRGIIDFRHKRLPDYRETFAQLALGQRPDTLFIACSDSRVVPNLFASTEPGDLFVVRNVGNLISPQDPPGKSMTDVSEAAAIEFSLQTLPIKDIIICGHSECGAMCAMIDGREKIIERNPHVPHLVQWLRHAEPSMERLNKGESFDKSLSPHNQLSQINVLQQIEHMMSYPLVRQRVEEGSLMIHGWWFDIKDAEVYAYDDTKKKFVLIDDEYAMTLLRRFGPFQRRKTPETPIEQRLY